jgi:RNA polymerase sigma-32 factor
MSKSPKILATGSVLEITNSLQNYLTQIYRIPLLTDKEEQYYAKQKAGGDLNAAKILINSHLRLVVKIAMKYKNYGLPMMDLISEGNIGLMKAVKEFDLSKNCKLATYAMWWIRASIQDYVLKSWSLVKIGTTISQKKLFFNLNKIKNRIMSHDQKYLSNDNVKYIANTLNIDSGDIVSMDTRINHRDVFLNKKSNNDEDGREIIELIKDNRENAESIVIRKSERRTKNKVFKEAFDTLNEREKDIIMKRHFTEEKDQITLKELSQTYGISSERIRQIEENAINKIRDYIKKHFETYGG